MTLPLAEEVSINMQAFNCYYFNFLLIHILSWLLKILCREENCFFFFPASSLSPFLCILQIVDVVLSSVVFGCCLCTSTVQFFMK